MRQFRCGNLQSSVLGFGCGSVLGRVGRGASLRAMNVAWEMGITFFDTARSYGYGEAELVLGEFLRGKRDRALIATKYGVPPAVINPAVRMALPIARAARRIPAMRSRHREARQISARGRFSAAGLRESLETSLRQLQTDRIDVLFLHEATLAVTDQHEFMIELDSALRAGKVLRVGLYAEPDVSVRALSLGLPLISAVQFRGEPEAASVAELMRGAWGDALLVANHPFGGARRMAVLKATLDAMAQDPGIPATLREKLTGDDWRRTIEALFGVLLDGTAIHALVFSMIEIEHIRDNVQAIEDCRFSAADLNLIQQRVMESASAQSMLQPHFAEGGSPPA